MSKEAYKQRAEAKIEEGQAKLKEARAKAKGASADARLEAEKHIGELEKQLDEQIHLSRGRTPPEKNFQLTTNSWAANDGRYGMHNKRERMFTLPTAPGSKVHR
jgi:hypothetical protein